MSDIFRELTSAPRILFYLGLDPCDPGVPVEGLTWLNVSSERGLS